MIKKVNGNPIFFTFFQTIVGNTGCRFVFFIEIFSSLSMLIPVKQLNDKLYPKFTTLRDHLMVKLEKIDQSKISIEKLKEEYITKRRINNDFYKYQPKK